jgi:hypothetical protein
MRFVYYEYDVRTVYMLLNDGFEQIVGRGLDSLVYDAGGGYVDLPLSTCVAYVTGGQHSWHRRDVFKQALHICIRYLRAYHPHILILRI